MNPVDERVVLVRIESVRMDGRHRREMGDIGKLAKSIADVGQLQPIVLGPDNRLIAGGRRIAALRRLGKDVVRAVYRVDLAEVSAALRAERDENTCREDMRPSELASLSDELLALERPKAEAARREGNARGGRRQVVVPGNNDLPQFDSRNAVATALGVSPATLGRVRQVHAVATDEAADEAERERAQRALDEMDRTGTVKPVYEKWRDGKEVGPSSEVKAPPRKTRMHLTKAFDRATGDLVRIAERLDRLTTDERFPYNAEQVARMNRHDLLRALDLLAKAVDRVPSQHKESTE